MSYLPNKFCLSELINYAHMNLNVNAASVFQKHGYYFVFLHVLTDLTPFPPHTFSYG